MESRNRTFDFMMITVRNMTYKPFLLAGRSESDRRYTPDESFLDLCDHSFFPQVLARIGASEELILERLGELDNWSQRVLLHLLWDMVGHISLGRDEMFFGEVKERLKVILFKS